jgi:hypothetical protein
MGGIAPDQDVHLPRKAKMAAGGQERLTGIRKIGPYGSVHPAGERKIAFSESVRSAGALEIAVPGPVHLV